MENKIKENNIKKKKLINWFCLSGIVSVLFYILHDILGAMHYPNYNMLSQALSDLTAKDAPSFVIANGYITVYGIFNCLCCAVVSMLMENEENKVLKTGVYIFTTMNFISAVGYALFPLTSAGFDETIQSIIHVYVITTLVVLLSIISLILIAIGALNKKHKTLGVLAILSLILMFIGAVGSNLVPKEYFGVIERFSTYSAVIFTLVLGIYGFKQTE